MDASSDGRLNALALVCTLKPTPAPSSTQLLAQQVLDELSRHDVCTELLRVVDHDVRAGVDKDMGSGDEWPAIRAKLLDADIVLFATPTWLGQHSSVCQRVLERLDAELSEKDDSGRLLTFDKVAIVAVVGNEDGAHHISAVLFQALNDVGFTVPAQGVTYWHDDVGGKYRNYLDLPTSPAPVRETNRTVARHAVHLAELLRRQQYPPPSSPD